MGETPGTIDRLRNHPAVRVGMLVVGVAAVVLCVRSVASRWNDAASFDLDLTPAPVLGAVVCVIAANTVLALSWGWLLKRLGHGLGVRRTMQVWWTGQLGTYLPTGL